MANGPSLRELHSQGVRDIIMRHRAERLAEIRAYTHAVTYMSNGRLCHIGGTLTYCEDFASDCRGCKVVPYTEEMRKVDTDHCLSWRPYTRLYGGNGDMSGW